MSDNFITFLRVTADEKEATEAIDAAVTWLLDEALIVEKDDGGDDFHGQYREGPNHRRAFTADYPLSPQDTRRPLFGLSVSKDWLFVSNVDGFEWPPCPRCGVPLVEDTAKHLVFEWMDTRVEPRARCASCGHSDLLGNFEHVWAGYCTYASLSFVNSWSLDKEFEHELLHRIGGRSRVLYVRL